MTGEFLSVLINAAVRALLFAGVAGLALKLCRVREVTARLAAWTAVLYGALLMPLAVATAPPLSVTVRSAVAHPTNVLVSRPSAFQDLSAPISAPSSTPRFDWSRAIVAVYSAIAGLLFVRLLMGWTLTTRLRRRSRRLDDPRLVARGVRRMPELLESERLAVPIALGWLKPCILLPVAWREWEQSKLDAVLTHELSHIRRGDYATLLLSSFHRCLFWFSPLSWWLDRHLRDLAEQASDDSVLLSTADHTSYAEVVLGFFEARHNSRGRIRWQGVAMAQSGRADRRIDRILATNRRLAGPARRPVLVALAGITLPLLYLSAAITPRTQAPAPPLPILAAQPVSQTPAHSPARPAARVVAQAAPQAPAQPTPSTAPTPPRDATPRDKAQDSYVIVHGDSMTMSGSSEDLQHVRALQDKFGDEFVWFRHSGKSYIVRDKATVRAARELFESNNDLARRKAYLADLKANLADQKALLGERKNSFAANMPDMSRELESLKQRLRDGGTQEHLSEVQALLSEMQAKASERRANISEQQSKLGELQAQLSERQAQLSEQQAVLSEMQARRSEEAFRALKILLDKAIQQGLAEPEIR
ncbi:MAG TPA: M56 family metallopeptidase [Bryobacteraceae bacterium]|nr:M56 family metallopeptidase [Bryobacteraceae bacterium]